jgi:hypothetical protein
MATSRLPQETVDYLKAWMMSPLHINHPYPSEQEKAEIMAETGIELKKLTRMIELGGTSQLHYAIKVASTTALRYKSSFHNCIKLLSYLSPLNMHVHVKCSSLVLRYTPVYPFDPSLLRVSLSIQTRTPNASTEMTPSSRDTVLKRQTLIHDVNRYLQMRYIAMKRGAVL